MHTTAAAHVDTIVIGSGFGGSVVAYRLAAAGKRVCLLERGRVYPPGSFPRTPADMALNFWDPSQGMHGLYNVWSFRGMEALVSSGLGGGSLIYANVLLRKDERWFVHEESFGGGYEHWPITRADLDPHYDEVERMLGAQTFPLSSPGYDAPKTLAMREAASRLGLDWQLPNLAVTFANPGSPARPAEPMPVAPYGNIHGLPRTTCQLCGECDVGCNYGSKNTLDHTYLSAAAFHGADIRTRSEVRRISPLAGGGYEVGYVEHHPEAEGRRTDTGRLPEITLTADRVVLAAGALGSTYLLLRNRSALTGLGPALGTRFSGNGDLLSFLLRARQTTAGTKAPRPLEASRGPVITSAIRVPDTVDEGDGRGYYIEDAGFPSFITWMIEGTQLPGTARRALRFALRRLISRITKDPRSDLGGEIAALMGDGGLSTTSLPLLGMGRDTPDGVVGLRGRKGWLDVDWNTKSSEEYFGRVRATMADIAGELGADFQENPLALLKRVITVHPLGGAPMGRHDGEGVVDEWGETFGHPGLYVVDGSAMPGPTGANPSLTIAAFADRVATGIIEGRSGRGGKAVSAPAPAPAGVPEVTTLAFTEEMKGHLTLGATDFRAGAEGADKTFCMFHLTITVTDVERFVADPDHPGSAIGWLECEPLGGRLPVERGDFNLFVDSGDPTRRWMKYRLFLRDGAGNPLTFVGFKDVHDDHGLDLWSDTSTLYTRILGGHVEPDGDDAAPVVAAGVLTIWLQDFAKQLTTFRVTGADATTRARAFGAFGHLFMGTLWKLYAPAAAGS